MAALTRRTGGVRVRVAEALALPGDPVLRVGFADEPLHMTNPSVVTGPLGGMAILDPPGGDGAVLAQRHPLLVDGEPSEASLDALGGGRHALREPSGRTRLVLGPERPAAGGTSVREVLVDGFRVEVELEDEHLAALRERATAGRSVGAHHGPLQVRAIIPGKVVTVSVVAGDTVEAGQQLLAIEAMKMQNELRAPRDGTVERVGVGVGQAVELGDLLVVIS